jgi:hypothetical protein
VKTLSAIAMTTVVFGALGPAIGAAVIWLERPPGSVRDVLVLSYVFGGIPALIAGLTYGGVRARRLASTSRWYTRAMLGAGAGVVGCLVFFVLVSGYDLLTVSEPTIRDLDIGFFRRLVAAGIPAGTVCALLIGPRRSFTS